MACQKGTDGALSHLWSQAAYSGTAKEELQGGEMRYSYVI